MAGEWIKFEASTPEKQEVFAITVAMGWTDPDLTVGKLLKVWRWFDQQTIAGNAPSVTFALLDCISGVVGFAEAMCNAGWLVKTNEGLMLPHFDRHNGKTAKDRALTAKRVANHKSNDPSNAKGNAPSVSSALPKEEKRREEDKEQSPKAPSKPKFNPVEELAIRGVDAQTAHDWMQVRKAKKLPLTLSALQGVIDESNQAGLSLERALAISCKNGWAGFKAEWIKETADAPAAKKDWI